jgi:hypothetical protein
MMEEAMVAAGVAPPDCIMNEALAAHPCSQQKMLLPWDFDGQFHK